MRPRDLFGVAVRAIGIWWLTQGLYWLYYAYWRYRGGSTAYPGVPFEADIGMSLGYLILGTVLFIFADHIVRVAYGPQLRTVPTDTDDGELSTDASSDAEPPR